MAALAGRAGSIDVSGSKCTFVGSWEASIEDEALETTGLGATTYTGIGRGLPKTSFTINFNALDLSDTPTLALLTAAQANATGLTCKFYVSGTKYYASPATSCFITGLSTSTDVQGLVTGSVSGVVSGALTYT